MATATRAQPSGLLFRWHGNLNKGGLNFVNDILFDSKNRVWVGAQTGFYKYDGNNYFPYRKTNDPQSLPNNFVHALCEDKQGNIWGSTDDGIFKFMPTQQVFTAYRLPDTTGKQNVYNICATPDGNIWASTFGVLFRFNTQKNDFDLIAPLATVSETGNANRIKKRGLLPSSDGRHIWAVTNEGIFYFDTQKNTWNSAKNHPGIPLFAKRNTSALAAGVGGNFLFFDLNQKQIVIFNPDDFSVVKTINVSNKIPDANAAVLFQANDEKIWFSSWNNDVAVIDPLLQDSVYLVKAAPNNPLALPSNFFWRAQQDIDGTIWFGTSDGIYTTNDQKGLYKVHELSKKIGGLGEKISIVHFLEDPNDQSWWLHTSNGQIIHYYPANGSHKTVSLQKAIPNKEGNLPSIPTQMYFVDRYPVFTFPEGAWVSKGDHQPLIPLSTFLNTNIPIKVQQVASGTNGILYLTDGKELYVWKKETNTIHKPYVTGTAPMQKPEIKLFAPGYNGAPIYAAFGLSAIGMLQPDTIKTVNLINNTLEINTGFINDIKADTEGNVWVCYTNLGLMRYRPETKQLKRWDDTNGLPLNYIATIAIDQNSNIWTMHRRYFSVLIKGVEIFFNFSYPKVEVNPTWYALMQRLQNGHIVANNFNDIIEFNPSKLLQQPVIRTPDISSLWVNEAPVNHDAGLLLKLNPDENSLRFAFGLLTDPALFPHELFYKLDGADREWKPAGASSQAIYNKLPPGTYTFQVKALSKNGIWESPESTLQLRILKPFYKTNWFFVLSGLVLAAMLYTFYRYRLKQQTEILSLENKAEALEKEKALIQFESLKQQLNPHLLFNSLTSLRSLIKKDTQHATKFLDGMSRTYRYILKSGDKELVTLREEMEFVKTFTHLQEVRFGDGLKVNFSIEEEDLDKLISPVILQNLVENAIKHNTTSTDSPLVIDISTEDGYVTVKNNLQRYHVVDSSNQSGLRSLKKLYEFYTTKALMIEEDEECFVVKIPLL
jgi:streptogramin lyase